MKTISTHAPLAGRDGSQPLPQAGIRISTHAPLAGRDRILRRWIPGRSYFNPRAPCGARPFAVIGGVRIEEFQPTRPLRGATSSTQLIQLPYEISTHAPLAGRDLAKEMKGGFLTYFNPRAPCGARPLLRNFPFLSIPFQPTRPLRGATQQQCAKTQRIENFNPRAPCGARQQKCTNHYAHFCDNRQISDAFTQNAACQGILLLFDAGKPCGFWVRTAQVISAHLCFAL